MDHLNTEQVEQYRRHCAFTAKHGAPKYSEEPIQDKIAGDVLILLGVSASMARAALFFHFGFKSYNPEDVQDAFTLFPADEDEQGFEGMDVIGDNHAEFLTHTENYQCRCMQAAAGALELKKSEEIAAIRRQERGWFAWYRGVAVK